MMTRIQTAFILLGALLLPPVQSYAQPRLTDVTLFTTDSHGNFQLIDFWDTRPTNSSPDTFITFIQGGAAGGPFLTGPTAANARPNIPLSLGASSFRLFAEPGFDNSYFGINLFFNGSSTPSISAYGPMLTAQGPHSFAADSSTMTEAPGPFGLPGPTNFVAGAGTLSFISSGEQVTLTDFYWAKPSVYNLDMVGPYSTGANGVADYVGGVSFSVSQVPEPGLSLWGLALLCGAIIMRRSSKLRTLK